MADEIVLIDVVYETDESVKNIDLLASSIDALEKENKVLIDQQKEIKINMKKTDEALKKEGKSRDELVNKYKKNSKEIDINKSKLQKERKERKDSIKLITAETGSRDKLRLTISKLRKERNALNVSTVEGAAKSEELRDKINKLDKSLKDSGTQFEKDKLSIGGYAEGIKEAFGGLGIFGQALDKSITFQQKFNNIVSRSGKSFKVASAGTSKASKALKIFKFALISTGIGIIVIALGALVAMFSKTQGGTNKMSKALAQVRAVIDSVIGRFTRLGEAVSKLFKGDFKGAAESAKKAFAGLKEEIKETIKEAGSLADLTVKYKNENREIEKQISILEARRELERDIAEDDTIGFAKRAEFYKKEAATIIELASIKTKIAQNNLSLIQGEIDLQTKKNLKISDEQKDALKDAQIAIKQAETEKLLSQRNSEELRRKGVRDLFEYELDFLIDLQEKQKQINIERINDSKLSLSERQKILEETARLSEESFERQEKAVEEFTGIKIDFDKLAAESDAKTIFNKLKLLDLDDITLNRSREIIQERKLALNDFANLEKKLSEESFERKDKEIEKEILDDIAKTERLELLEEKKNEILEAAGEKRRETIRQIGAEIGAISNDLANLLIGSNQKQLDKELVAIEEKSKKEIALAGGDAARITEIEKKAEADKEKIRKKAAKDNQKIQIGNAIIQGALVVLNALTTQPFVPAGLLATVGAGIATGLQVATIKQQSFGKGGKVQVAKNGMQMGAFSGASHTGGGIDLFTGSGQHVANVEGKENFYVVNKNASGYINTLSDINQRIGGGVALSNKSTRMQDGGQADINNNQPSIDEITANVIENLPPIFVRVESIKTGVEQFEEVVEVGVI